MHEKELTQLSKKHIISMIKSEKQFAETFPVRQSISGISPAFHKKQMLAQPMPDKEIVYCFFLSGLTSPEKEENEQYKKETGRIKRN